MKINLYPLSPEKLLREFADYHGLVMQIHQKALYLFHASFSDIKVKTSRGLLYPYGTGETPELAMANYAGLISNEIIVINDNEVPVPNLRLPETL